MSQHAPVKYWKTPLPTGAKVTDPNGRETLVNLSKEIRQTIKEEKEEEEGHFEGRRKREGRGARCVLCVGAVSGDKGKE